ncbi:putative cyclin-D6-1 isoform X2 [Diospyros lotus]|uniref:putative cyclin-D6-1 isoform X2 n=1 Tax=Diospyros lotus TaxID=55363 RepID=UPI002253B7E5|nr:putative cyclin-D6-1 isoform X2 [Diospyros lotus]
MAFDLENPLPSTPSLFHTEYDHMPSQNYSQSLKAADLEVSLRHETVSLILQYCSSRFHPFISYLAVNYLDRFLSAHAISGGQTWMASLLAVSCVSLALKMREEEVLVTDIQNDGRFIFDVETIRRMEILILGALRWRMRSITPFCFVNFFLSLFNLKDPPLLQALKARATEIIFKAQYDIKLLEFQPSLVAASALLSASHELFPLQFPRFKKAVSNCPYVNKEKLFGCWNAMQEIVMEGYESVLEAASSSSTPASILDLRCSSESSSSDLDGEKNNERGIKRRKII